MCPGSINWLFLFVILFLYITKFKIILTGGYADIFAKFVNNNSTIDKHITIKGIMFIYKNLVK